MLHVGDKVVHPMHGAGVVTGIEDCTVLGKKKTYYVMEMSLGDMKVMIPKDNVETIGIRSVISKEEVQEVKEILEEEPESIKGTWNKRFRASLSRIKTGDIKDVAAVFRNLIIQEQVNKISSGEKRLLDLAKNLLISELTYACSKPASEVESWMDDILLAKEDSTRLESSLGSGN